MASASRTNTRAVFSLIAIAVGVLIVNGHLQQRQRDAIFAADDSLPLPDDLPPTLYLTTVALGPARSLVSNMLWWRAVRMQDEGNYYEAIQLSSWISNLQPRMPNVWTYQAWNMAFNITAEIPVPDPDDTIAWERAGNERYTWIMSGITLMRDQGLTYNPRDPTIQTEISRIYFQKMAEHRDPFARYYERRWAQEMYRYYPQGTQEEFVAVASAPDSLEDLRRDPVVRALVTGAAAQGLDLMDLDVHEIGYPLSEKQAIIMQDPLAQKPLADIRHYLVKQAIPRELKMDVELMLFINDRYGPFDWRLPQAHAVYWGSNESFHNVGEDYGEFDYAIVRQAMVSSFLSGRLVYLSSDELITTNNLEIIPNLDEYLHTLTSPSSLSLKQDFHRRGAVILYVYMQEAGARDFHHTYKGLLDAHDPRAKETFEQFIEREGPEVFFADAATAGRQSLVTGSLLQCYTWLAMQEPARARGFYGMAKLLYDRNQTTYAGRPELLLPPWDELQRLAFDMAVGPQSTLPPQLQQNLQIMTGGDPDNLRLPEAGAIQPLDLGSAHRTDADAEHSED